MTNQFQVTKTSRSPAKAWSNKPFNLNSRAQKMGGTKSSLQDLQDYRIKIFLFIHPKKKREKNLYGH